MGPQIPICVLFLIQLSTAAKLQDPQQFTEEEYFGLTQQLHNNNDDFYIDEHYEPTKSFVPKEPVIESDAYAAPIPEMNTRRPKSKMHRIYTNVNRAKKAIQPEGFIAPPDQDRVISIKVNQKEKFYVSPPRKNKKYLPPPGSRGNMDRSDGLLSPPLPEMTRKFNDNRQRLPQQELLPPPENMQYIPPIQEQAQNWKNMIAPEMEKQSYLPPFMQLPEEKYLPPLNQDYLPPNVDFNRDPEEEVQVKSRFNAPKQFSLNMAAKQQQENQYIPPSPESNQSVPERTPENQYIPPSEDRFVISQPENGVVPPQNVEQFIQQEMNGQFGMREQKQKSPENKYIPPPERQYIPQEPTLATTQKNYLPPEAEKQYVPPALEKNFVPPNLEDQYLPPLPENQYIPQSKEDERSSQVENQNTYIPPNETADMEMMKLSAMSKSSKQVAKNENNKQVEEKKQETSTSEKQYLPPNQYIPPENQFTPPGKQYLPASTMRELQQQMNEQRNFYNQNVNNQFEQQENNYLPPDVQKQFEQQDQTNQYLPPERERNNQFVPQDQERNNQYNPQEQERNNQYNPQEQERNNQYLPPGQDRNNQYLPPEQRSLNDQSSQQQIIPQNQYLSPTMMTYMENQFIQPAASEEFITQFNQNLVQDSNDTGIETPMATRRYDSSMFRMPEMFKPKTQAPLTYSHTFVTLQDGSSRSDLRQYAPSNNTADGAPKEIFINGPQVRLFSTPEPYFGHKFNHYQSHQIGTNPKNAQQIAMSRSSSVPESTNSKYDIPSVEHLKPTEPNDFIQNHIHNMEHQKQQANKLSTIHSQEVNAQLQGLQGMESRPVASFIRNYAQPTPFSVIPTTEGIPIIKQSSEMALDGSFSYETLTGDQTHIVQQGHIENPGTDDEEQVIHGSYSYVGSDGNTYTVHYVADGNGFRASGDHLPTPPPVPEIIQRAIEFNLNEEAERIARDLQKYPHQGGNLATSIQNVQNIQELKERTAMLKEAANFNNHFLNPHAI